MNFTISGKLGGFLGLHGTSVPFGLRSALTALLTAGAARPAPSLDAPALTHVVSDTDRFPGWAALAPRVRDLFERYGLSYNARPLPKQVASAWHKVLRLSLPNGWLEETTWSNAPRQVAKLFRASRPAPAPEPASIESRRRSRPASLVAALI